MRCSQPDRPALTAPSDRRQASVTALALRPWPSLRAPLVAGVLALGATLASLRGVDLPAQLYRVSMFHRVGLTLWDSGWYGGHWTLNYSVLFPPVAGVLGVAITEALSAAAAALAFDRLVTGHFDRTVRVGSLLFAVGTLAQVAIGQLPFLLGEALALGSCWAATRGRWPAALTLGVATALASPLAGAFLALAALAWSLTSKRDRRLRPAALLLAAGIPMIGLSAVFPGQGTMPFPLLDSIWLVVIFSAVMLALPRGQRALRTGLCLYLGAIVLSYLLPTPVGGNISRLGECVGAPLLVCVLWPRRRLLLAVGVIPLVLLQWVPALASFTSDRRDASAVPTYFRPLLGFLARHGQPMGRIEVVPTHLHWEAADIAPTVPLARGWERQLDTADNPIFYTPGALTPASYRAWLLNNGVRWVGLPDVPLDYAGQAEGRLLERGVPGLLEAWHDAHWRLFAVSGSPGIVDGPGHLLHLDARGITVAVSSPGRLTVRVRSTSPWTLLSGTGCVSSTPNGWLSVDVQAPGELHLAPQLGPGGQTGC